MRKQEMIAIRLSTQERELLKQQAQIEDRTEAALVRRALSAYYKLVSQHATQRANVGA